MKKSLIVLLTITVMGSLISGVCAKGALAAPKPIKLVYGTYTAPGEAVTRGIDEWVKAIEEKFAGRIQIDVQYGGTLGKPNEYYDLVTGGVCDFAHVLPSYVPGAFPLIQVLMLPIENPGLEPITKAMVELYKRGYFDKELAQVQAIWMCGASSWDFLWVEKPARSLEDFKGRKIRCAGGPFNKAVQALGAIPVNLPITEAYLAMQRGIVDGIVFSWSMIKDLNFHEVSKYVTETDRFSYPFIDVMNKDTFNKLPSDIQAYIRDYDTIEKFSLIARRKTAGKGDIGRKMALDAGIKVDRLSEADMNRMEELFEPIFEEWVTKNEAKGLPARKVLNDLRSIIKELK